jgi:putative transposase
MYHMTARGNHRQDIFFKHADRQQLDNIMAHALEHTGARIHAYCWMTNHLHLLVHVADQPLGALMQRVGTQFARMIQKELATTGHLFENRYHALLVDVDAYFLELLRYIHLNPAHARIVDVPEQYRWSSHRVYLGKIEQPWVHTDFGLSLFSRDLIQAREGYKCFINQQIGAPSDASKFEGHPKERRVLGDDVFLDKLSIPVLNRYPKTTLDQITNDICNRLSVSREQVKSANQDRVLCAARAMIAKRAIDEHVANLSEVARFLNRSASALSRAIVRYQK